MNRLLSEGNIFSHLSRGELIDLLESEGLTVGDGKGEIKDNVGAIIFSPRKSTHVEISVKLKNIVKPKFSVSFNKKPTVDLGYGFDVVTHKKEMNDTGTSPTNFAA